MLVNQTHAFSVCTEVYRQVRDLAYTIAQPDVDTEGMDEFTAAGITAAATVETLTYAPWDFHLTEPDPDDRPAFEQLEDGPAAEIVVFDSNAPLAAVSIWRAPAEFLADTPVGARPSVLLTAWIVMNGDLVPMPTVVVSEEGVTYVPNAGLGGDHESTAQEVVALARLLSVEHTAFEAKASRKVRRSAEQRGPVPLVVIRAAESAIHTT